MKKPPKTARRTKARGASSEATPRQRLVIRAIETFFGEVFASADWPTPTVSALSDSPGFTSYVLPVPSTIRAQAVTKHGDMLARALRRAENEVVIMRAPRDGGVVIQVRKPESERGVLWFDEAIVAGPRSTGTHGPLVAVIGTDERNRPLVVDLADPSAPHLLVIGQTGSGKSSLFHTLLVQLLAKNGPDELRLAVLDPRGRLGMHYHGLPHLWAPVVEGPDGAIAILAAIENELRQRRERFAAQKASTIEDYRRLSGQALPRLLFVVDDAASLSNADDELIAAAYAGIIRKLANIGRALGVYLLIGAQRPTQANVGDFRDTLTQRVILALASPAESAMAFGGESSNTWATKLGGRGDGFLVTPMGAWRFCGAYLPAGFDPRALRLAKGALTVDQLLEAIIRKWGGPKNWYDEAAGEAPDDAFPTPPDPYEVFSPRQRTIARALAFFVKDNFKPARWPDPRISAVLESAEGTDFVLPLPNKIRVTNLVAMAGDFARAILRPEAEVSVIPAAQLGGVIIRVHRAEADLTDPTADGPLAHPGATAPASGVSPR